LPLKYQFYAYKTLVVGLVPPKLLMAYREWKYKARL
jgi:hypothetical protein